MADPTRARTPNTRLRKLLDEAGITHDALARRVNAIGRTRGLNLAYDRTAVGHWLTGTHPRGPAPDLVAEALAAKLGRTVDARAIWPSSQDPAGARVALPADYGLAVPWTTAGLHRIAADWEHMHRREFLTLSGAALTAPALDAATHPAPDLTTERRTRRVDTPTLELVDHTVHAAQRIDDAHGAGALDYVIDQTGAVARILTRDSYTADTGRRLAAALAQLAQTAAFMAHEATHDGRAQRLYLAALHAAHSADDKPLAASVLSLMSNQATALGRHDDALDLAEAAQTAARGSAGQVRALVSARTCLAHAARGDAEHFERAVDDAHQHLIEATGDAPPWAYYVTPTEVDAITGRSMAMLAQQLSPSAARRRYLAHAETLLRPRAYAEDPTFARSSLRHSAWLGQVHAASGDLDEALKAGRHAVSVLPAVTSRRAQRLVTRLADDLHAVDGSRSVLEFARQVRSVLSENREGPSAAH